MKRSYKIPLYGGRLHVIIQEDIDDLAEMYPSPDRMDLSNWGAVTFWSDHRNQIYCAFREGAITPGLVAHESLHVMNQVFIRIGYHPEADNDETGAYLISWIVNRITEVQNERK